MIEEAIREHANIFAPRRRRAAPTREAQPMEQQPAPEKPAELQTAVTGATQQRQQLLTPNSLKIAETIDRMERDREQALDQRNDLNDQLARAMARIEQFEHRNAEIQREKEALEMKLHDAQRATDLERNERIRLSDCMESVIQLLQQKLPMPDPT